MNLDLELDLAQTAGDQIVCAGEFHDATQARGQRDHDNGQRRGRAEAAPAALWSRIAHARGDQALVLETIECGIHRTRRDIATGAIGQLGANRHAVRLVPEAQNREKVEVLLPQCYIELL